MLEAMQLGVLGPLEVSRGSVQVPLPRAQERRLLAALAVHAGESVSTDALVEALWPGEQQPQWPARALRTIVSRLRSLIGEEAVVAAPAGYRLAIPVRALDAARFEALLAEGRGAVEADPETAVAGLDQALALWRGDAYEEFAHEPFAQAEAVRLEELRVAAMEARIDARLALGQHEELVGELRALVARHPYSERLRQQLAVALYRSGRHTDALASLQAYRRLLGEELGLEPSPWLQDMEWRVLTHRVDPSTPHHDAPPSAASRRRRLEEELGLPSTRLIGREGATAAVLDALRRSRLVTLTGPGGVGKTRLAIHVAGEARERFAQGVAACSLAPVREAAAVPAALATALDVRQRQHRSLEESLVDVLQRRQLLVVIDNCEHVVDVAARLVALVVARCPGVTVMATSRERLGLTGEHVIDVPPLPVPDGEFPAVAGSAIELFRERARAVGVDIGLDPGMTSAMAQICRRLDGLPLAIELAAAQARALHPNDIAERLATSPLVSASLRDLADRHRSLHAVTDWSYELLTEPEKELFDGLSVFAGSFDWYAIKGVAHGAGLAVENLADLLNALVDKSMLAVRPGPRGNRYVVLETLRSYGREQLLRRGTESCWRRAHARHYVEVAEQAERGLRGSDEPRWMEVLGQDMDNLRQARRWSLDHEFDAAVRLVAALSWFRFRTLQTELELWAEETAVRAPEHPLAPLLLGSAALGAWSRGELVRAGRLARAAIATTVGPEQRLARDALGAICLVEGNLRDALHHFEHAIVLDLQAGDRYHEAWCTAGQAVILGYLQRTADAARRVEEGESIARELQCPSLLAWVLYVRGECLVETNPDRALQLLDRSETLARQVGHQFVVTVAGISAITVRARRGDAAAIPLFRGLLEELERIGNRTQLWVLLRSLVYVLAKAGHHESSAVLLSALESSATAVEPYGPDHERLVEAGTTVAEKATAKEVEAWKEQGRAMDDRQAIAYALTAIDRAFEANR